MYTHTRIYIYIYIYATAVRISSVDTQTTHDSAEGVATRAREWRKGV